MEDTQCVNAETTTFNAVNATTVSIASYRVHFEAWLERAARTLCESRGIEPDVMVPYDNGTVAFASRLAWQSAADEIKDFRLLHMIAHSFP